MLQNGNILDRLEKVRASFLAGLQEIESVKQQVANSPDRSNTQESWWNADQVAELLQLKKKRVYAMARKNEIPAVKIGKYWKFSPSRLQKWMERRYTS
jgi:excisionase family DNA binding protein